MTLHRGSSLFAFTLALAAPGLAQAATANCMSPDGVCEVSNDGFDSLECECADGSGGGIGGGNEWAGLTEMELIPICEEQLAAFCGPFVPPDYVECGSLFGYCMIDNEPEDELECECWDGTGSSVAGGMAWAGWDDLQLFAECEVQLSTICVPPPMPIVCSNANGECTIANDPADFLGCECSDGSGGGTSGGNSWAGYDELQLDAECGLQLVDFCGGPLPPPPWQECSSSLGECLIDNDPDRLECTCTNGDTIDVGGGSEWSGLSDEELFTECEQQLYDGCSEATGSSSGSESGTADAGDADGTGSSGSEGSTGVPGDTGVDDSTGGGSSGTPPPADTGDDTSGGASDSSDGGAAGDGDGGGCSCSAKGESSSGGWALMLLALVGLRRRHRATSRAA